MRYNTQSGIALIILLAIFMLSATGVLLYRLNNRTYFMIENQAQTAQALAKAKEALIGHAATYAKTHPGQPQGYLPCPDNNGDGSAETSCSTTGNSVIGRFPWKTLGLPPLRDGSGECLWYAVSGSYKCNPKKILTSDSDGLFIVKDSADNTIVGEKEINRAIAIVFAPGRIINGQDRSVTPGKATECGSDVIKKPVDPINDVKNYLDNYKNESSGLEINNYTGDGTLSFVPSNSGDSGFFATTTPSTTPPTLPPTSTFITAPLTRKDGNITEVTFNDVLMLITPKDFEPVYRRMDYWVAKRVEGCLNKYAATLDSTDEPFDKYPWASQLSSNNSTGNNGERFGRISQTPNSSSLYTSMPNVWPIDPHLIDLLDHNKVKELLELLELDKKTEKALKKLSEDDLKIILTEILDELDLVLVENIAVDDLKDKLDSNEKKPLEKLSEAEQDILLEGLLKELEDQRCFKDASLNNWEWRWWNEWNKMVFFAVDDGYCPTCSPTPVSPTMTLSGDAMKMKMIVLVAGRRLMEERDETKRADYLEGKNSDGNEEFEKGRTTPTFNDVVLGTPPPPPPPPPPP